MLFRQTIREKVLRGEVGVAFRRWTKPSVRSGGTMVVGGRQLAIDAVTPVDPATLTEGDAQAAGEDSLADMLAAMAKGKGQAHRITFHLAGADPRLALRVDGDLSDEGMAQVLARLRRMDGKSPWTARFLSLVRDHPGRRAGDLAPMAGFDTPEFKVRVRRLKSLGLTISLEVGYRLSPRGEAVVCFVVQSGSR